MIKTKPEDLFTTVRVLKKSLEKLHDINSQEIKDNNEPIPEWKTLDNIINEKHKNLVKA